VENGQDLMTQSHVTRDRRRGGYAVCASDMGGRIRGASIIPGSRTAQLQYRVVHPLLTRATTACLSTTHASVVTSANSPKANFGRAHAQPIATNSLSPTRSPRHVQHYQWSRTLGQSNTEPL
jgi:hypothetical protein